MSLTYLYVDSRILNVSYMRGDAQPMTNRSSSLLPIVIRKQLLPVVGNVCDRGLGNLPLEGGVRRDNRGNYGVVQDTGRVLSNKNRIDRSTDEITGPAR